jgi:hypothetical protein
VLHGCIPKTPAIATAISTIAVTAFAVTPWKFACRLFGWK